MQDAVFPMLFIFLLSFAVCEILILFVLPIQHNWFQSQSLSQPALAFLSLFQCLPSQNMQLPVALNEPEQHCSQMTINYVSCLIQSYLEMGFF